MTNLAKDMGNYLDGYTKDICKHCKKTRTIEGYDGCIGFLPNVMNACCGHGENNVAYVQFTHVDYDKNPNKQLIKGEEAIKYINKHKR